MKEVIYRNRYVLITVAATIFLLVVWEAAARIIGYDIILPTFTSVCVAFAEMFVTGTFWISVAGTLLRSVMGFAVAFVLGVVLGITAGKYRALDSVLLPFNSVMRTIPVAAITLVLGVWLAPGVIPSIIGMMLIFPVVYEQSKTAVKVLPEELEEIMDEAGASFPYRFVNLYLPSVMPHILSNISATFGMNLKAVITAETLMLALNSIGLQIHYAYSNFLFETPALFAWVLTAVLMSVGIEAILKFAVKKSLRV